MRALTVGGAMIDTIAIIENTAIERLSLLNAGTSFLMLEEGKKTEAVEVSTHTGGGAINTAVAMARLGVACSVLIKLGDDRRADQIQSRLDEEGISHRWAVRVSDAPTGASVHVSSHDRNAAVFTFRGANTLLTPADLAADAFDVDLVYIANLSNEASECFPDIVAKARAAGALIAANPGLRQLQKKASAFQAALSQLDILTLNRREAEEIVALLACRESDEPAPLDFPGGASPPGVAQTGLRHGRRYISLTDFFAALIARGVGTVVLTDGQEGAFAAEPGSLYYCPSRDVPVLGTAGAGDAFAATFTAYRASGLNIEVALRAAAINAGAVLGYVDTQTGLMARDALDADVARKNETPNVIHWVL